jgi:hypothetical protein
MASWKRISVVSSLVAYLLATSAVHALHDHSSVATCCCHQDSDDHSCTEPRAIVGSVNCDACDCDHCHSHAANDLARHNRLPSHSPDCDHCFACRFLAVKSVSPVAFAIVEQSEALWQIEPQEFLSAPVVRPDLPLSRGPPCA